MEEADGGLRIPIFYEAEKLCDVLPETRTKVKHRF
jgi:hypothetical protein